MPPAQAKESVEIVDIGSSDDDDDAAVPPLTRNKNSINSKLPQSRYSSSAASVDAQFAKQKLVCRSFWQADACEIGPSSFAPVEGELEHARVHPKFLHSNATSHKWAFGAIAVLLDSAVDEIHVLLRSSLCLLAAVPTYQPLESQARHVDEWFSEARALADVTFMIRSVLHLRAALLLWHLVLLIELKRRGSHKSRFGW